MRWCSSFLSLAVSGWVYRFALAGTSTLIAAAPAVMLGKGVMPRWLALAGFVVAGFALLRFLIPLGYIIGLVWVLAGLGLDAHGQRWER